MLRNRPSTLAIDCFIIHLKDGGSLTGKEASGRSGHKSKSKVGEDAGDIKNGVCYESIDYVWAFVVFKSMYQEPAGVPIARIAKQLHGLETLIYHKLG